LRDVCSSLRAHAGVLLVAVPAAASALVQRRWGGGEKLLFGSKVKVAWPGVDSGAGAFGICGRSGGVT